MKVIFLDIDGVLNTKETYDSIYRSGRMLSLYDIPLDSFRLEYLKTIVEETGAKIVLSSSFRHFFMREGEQLVPISLKGRKLYNIFFKYGIDIFDVTPTDGEIREDEIKMWLSSHANVEDFVIIDDDPNMFKELSNKLIQTSKVRQNYLDTFMKDSFGLCERHIPEIIDRLGNKKKIR